MKYSGDIDWSSWPSVYGPLIYRMTYALQQHHDNDGYRMIWGPFYCVLPVRECALNKYEMWAAEDDEYWYEKDFR